MKLCRYLRWKGFYGRGFRDDRDLAAALQRNDAQYSCLRTCQPWGPDDSLTVPERCQPGRGCFTLSPKDPSASPLT